MTNAKWTAGASLFALIVLGTIDIASSFNEIGYFNWGDQSASCPARRVRIESGCFCYVAAPSAYLDMVEWESGPPRNGWSIEASHNSRMLWNWQFMLSSEAALLYGPLWPAKLSLTGIAILAWTVSRPRTRMMAGCCRNCTHDLTGNGSGVCPECGTPITVKPPASNGTS